MTALVLNKLVVFDDSQTTTSFQKACRKALAEAIFIPTACRFSTLDCKASSLCCNMSNSIITQVDQSGRFTSPSHEQDSKTRGRSSSQCMCISMLVETTGSFFILAPSLLERVCCCFRPPQSHRGSESSSQTESIPSTIPFRYPQVSAYVLSLLT